MRSALLFCFLLSTCLSLPLGLLAATWHVSLPVVSKFGQNSTVGSSPSVGSRSPSSYRAVLPPATSVRPGLRFASIQAAIDHSASGDTIWVHPGHYFENVDFRSKYLFLLSAGGADVTILDGNHTGRVILASQGGYIAGFRIINGVARHGAGIFMSGRQGSVFDCVVENNMAAGGSGAIGGGLYVNVLDKADIAYNDIRGNVCENGVGGGVYAFCHNGRVHVRNNTVVGNRSGRSGGGLYASNAIIRENIVFSNYSHGFGAGIACVGNMTIERNTIFRNSQSDDEGGIGVYVSSSYNTRLVITRNIIAENFLTGTSTSSTPGLYCGYIGSVYVACNDIWGNDDDTGHCAMAAGNFSSDPMFCPASETLEISTHSPCADAPACGLVGATPPGCDMTAVEETTWTHIKRRFR